MLDERKVLSYAVSPSLHLCVAAMDVFHPSRTDNPIIDVNVENVTIHPFIGSCLVQLGTLALEPGTKCMGKGG